MPNIFVARRAKRKGFYLPLMGTKENPNLMFPLSRKSDRSELDNLVRGILDKQGITKESDVQSLVDKAELASEERIKVNEAIKEIKRLMALKAGGAKLMQMGHKKWKEAFYPVGGK